MTELRELVAQRLRQLKKNPFEAARDGGLERNFVNDIVNGKKRSVRGENLEKLSRGLDTTPAALLSGDFIAPDLPILQDARRDLDQVLMVPEYDVRLSAGPGFIVDSETTRREWPYPRFLVVDTLGVTPAKATVQEVIGDSMEPTISSGDFVLIDRGDIRLGNPGIFAVWDGDALVCKRVERIPGSRRVMLRSDNPLHGAYEVDEGDVLVVGRVRWITRRA